MMQSQVDTLKREKAGKLRRELLQNMNPDSTKLTDKSLLRDLLPKGWKEIVYEYENRFFINLSIGEAITKTEEFNIMDVITQELGSDNIILPTMTRNTEDSSSIIIRLKKSNYKEEVS